MNLLRLACVCGAVCWLVGAGAAEPTSNRPAGGIRTVTPVVLQTTDLGDLFMMGQSVSGEGEAGMWLWKVDRQGMRFVERWFPAPEEEEPVAAVNTVEGGLMVVGSRFVHEPRVGYRAWLMSFNRLGVAESARTLEGYGRPAALLRMEEESLLLAGLAPSAQTTGTQYDVWLEKFSSEGSSLWSRRIDRGAEDAVAGVLPDADNGFLLVVNSEGVGLLQCSAEGEVVREAKWPDVRITTQGGAVATVLSNGFAVAVSTSPLPALNEIKVSGSSAFDARVLFVDTQLRRRGQVDLKGYSSFVTPVLVAAPDGGCVAAGVAADGIRLTSLSGEGALQWEKTARFGASDKPSVSSVSAAAVTGGMLYVMGMCLDLTEGSLAEKVFLLKADLENGKVLWLKTY